MKEIPCDGRRITGTGNVTTILKGMRNNLQEQLQWLERNREQSIKASFSKSFDDPSFHQQFDGTSANGQNSGLSGSAMKLTDILNRTQQLRIQREETRSTEQATLATKKVPTVSVATATNPPKTAPATATSSSTSSGLQSSSYTLVSSQHKYQEHQQANFRPSSAPFTATSPTFTIAPLRNSGTTSSNIAGGGASGHGHSSVTNSVDEEAMDKAFLELDVEAVAQAYFSTKQSTLHTATAPIPSSYVTHTSGNSSHGSVSAWSSNDTNRGISSSRPAVNTYSHYSPTPAASTGPPTVSAVSTPSYYPSASNGRSTDAGGLLSELHRKRAELDEQIRAAEMAARGAAAVVPLPATSTAPTSENICTHTAGKGSMHMSTSSALPQERAHPQYPPSQYLSSLIATDSGTYTSSWDATPQAMYTATNAAIAPYIDYEGGAAGRGGFYGGDVYDVDASVPLCECGVPCIKLTSRTSANMNRQFYKCANAKASIGDGSSGNDVQQGPTCRFFEWVDQDGSSNFVAGGGADGRSNVIRDFSAENRRVFGHKAFRAGQRECIEAALEGGGKSLIYQLPAWCCAGLAVVFCPLVSLIQDQVDAMTATGIRAVYVTSTQDENEISSIYNSLYQMSSSASSGGSQSEDTVKLLYITPEKFKNSPKMRNALRSLYNKGLLSRFVIDEAHCLSEWGHDFRSDYLSLGGLRSEYPLTPILALTATANQSVVQDCIRIIQMRNPYRHTLSFNRENIEYTVRAKDSKVISYIADIVRAKREQTGIIYCFSKKDTEKVTADLRLALPEMKNKIDFYHADVSPDVKERRQRLWSKGDIKIICATIAFGMGINKPDVRYVIHYSMPKSLTNFYQESGRAGRDGFPSESIVFYNYSDKQRLCALAQKGNSSSSGGDYDGGGMSLKNKAAVERAIANIHRCAEFCMNEIDCRRSLVLTYFGENFPADNCHSTCDNCKRTSGTGSSRMVWENYSEQATGILAIVQAIGDSSRQKLTLNKLRCLLSTSKDKSLEGYRQVLQRCKVNSVVCGKDKASTKPLSKGICEKVLHAMVMAQFLVEESQVTASSFTAEYISVGPKASQLLSGQVPLRICVPQPKQACNTSADDAATKSSEDSRRNRELTADGGGNSRVYPLDGLFEEDDVGNGSGSTGDDDVHVSGTRISTGTGRPIEAHPTPNTSSAATTTDVTGKTVPTTARTTIESGTSCDVDEDEDDDERLNVSKENKRFKPPYKQLAVPSSPGTVTKRNTATSTASSSFSSSSTTGDSTTGVGMRSTNGKSKLSMLHLKKRQPSGIRLTRPTTAAAAGHDADGDDSDFDSESSPTASVPGQKRSVVSSTSEGSDDRGVGRHMKSSRHNRGMETIDLTESHKSTGTVGALEGSRQGGDRRRASDPITVPPGSSNSGAQTNSAKTTSGTGAGGSKRDKGRLNSDQRGALQTWLWAYRKRWVSYWHYMNNQAVIQLTEKVPLSVDDLSAVISFGHAKIEKHGKHIINTIWAFLHKNGLLSLYPEVSSDTPPYPIEECVTWTDPLCPEAESIHRAQDNIIDMGSATAAGITSTKATSPPGKRWRDYESTGKDSDAVGRSTAVNTPTVATVSGVAMTMGYTPHTSTGGAGSLDSRSRPGGSQGRNLVLEDTEHQDMSQDSPDLLAQAAQKRHRSAVYHHHTPSSAGTAWPANRPSPSPGALASLSSAISADTPSPQARLHHQLPRQSQLHNASSRLHQLAPVSEQSPSYTQHTQQVLGNGGGALVPGGPVKSYVTEDQSSGGSVHGSGSSSYVENTGTLYTHHSRPHGAISATTGSVINGSMYGSGEEVVGGGSADTWGKKPNAPLVSTQSIYSGHNGEDPRLDAFVNPTRNGTSIAKSLSCDPSSVYSSRK